MFELIDKRSQIGVFRKTLPERIFNDSTGNAATWTFPNQSVFSADCISCYVPRCISWPQADISIPKFSDMSVRAYNHICPTEAISWDSNHEIPQIDATKCISCGVCASGCPVGAIFIDEDRDAIATVAASPNSSFETLPVSDSNTTLQAQQISELPRMQLDSPLADDRHVVEFYNSSKLRALGEASQNLLVQSVLRALHVKTVLTRHGDVYSRNDGAYACGESMLGPLEIEFGSDSLGALRTVLDDIAVFHRRYDVPVAELDGLIVFKSLPRNRQGYWQVIKDVQDVLNLRIHTVTLGALLLTLWSKGHISPETLRALTPSVDDPSIRLQIESAIGRPVNLRMQELEILKPGK